MKQEGHMIINNMPTGIVLLGRFFFFFVCVSLSLSPFSMVSGTLFDFAYRMTSRTTPSTLPMMSPSACQRRRWGHTGAHY